ncbi:MAG: hypothetical protein ACK4SM_03770 [Aquificaceae bacterium]
MRRVIRARVLLVKVPRKSVGIFTALMDGSGRKAIVRSKERDKDKVYLIATPDTYQELFQIVKNISKHIPGVCILEEVSSENMQIEDGHQ